MRIAYIANFAPSIGDQGKAFIFSFRLSHPDTLSCTRLAAALRVHTSTTHWLTIPWPRALPLDPAGGHGYKIYLIYIYIYFFLFYVQDMTVC